MSTYKAAGVDYKVLDAGKRSALAAAMTTSSLLGLRGGQADDESRGEPAFLFTIGDEKLALVLECLGTKSIIARKYKKRLASTGGPKLQSTRLAQSSTTSFVWVRCLLLSTRT